MVTSAQDAAIQEVFMKDVYTFESWCLETTTIEPHLRNKAVVDVLWDKYILVLTVISLTKLVLDMT